MTMRRSRGLTLGILSLSRYNRVTSRGRVVSYSLGGWSPQGWNLQKDETTCLLQPPPPEREKTENDSIPLHCTLLYSALLHSIPLHSTQLHLTPLHSTLIYSTLLQCTVLYCTPVQSTLLHSTPSLLNSSSTLSLLYSSLLYYTLPYPTLLSLPTALYCTVLFSNLYSTLTLPFPISPHSPSLPHRTVLRSALIYYTLLCSSRLFLLHSTPFRVTPDCFDFLRVTLHLQRAWLPARRLSLLTCTAL